MNKRIEIWFAILCFFFPVCGFAQIGNPNNPNAGGFIIPSAATSSAFLSALTSCQASASCQGVDARSVTNLTLTSPITISSSITILLGNGTFGMPTGNIITAGGVKILGFSQDLTTICINTTTGDLFSPRNAGFELGEVTVKPCGGIIRASGWVLNPNTAGKYGFLHDVSFVNVYGGVRLAPSGGAGPQGWRIYRINTSTSTGLHSGSLFSFCGNDGSAGVADVYVSDVYSQGNSALYDAPQLLLDSGCDTIKFVNYDAGYSSGAGSAAQTQAVIQLQNTNATFAPRWIRFIHPSNEAGGTVVGATADIFNIAAGNQIDIEDSYAANGNRGYTISGCNGCQIHGGVVGGNQNGGLYVTSAITQSDISVTGVAFSSNSLATTNTTDDINIAGGTTLFSIIGNSFDQGVIGGGGKLSRYFINLGAGATNNFIISGNAMNGTFAGTGFINNGATGLSYEIDYLNNGNHVFAGTAAGFQCLEGSGGPGGLNGWDALWCDSISHKWKANNNNGGANTFAYTDLAQTFSAVQSFSVHTLSTGPALSATNLSGCGTSPALVGTDNFGTITVGSAAGTSCVLTFGTAWGTAPSCVVSDDSAIVAIQPVSTTTTLTLTGSAALTGAKLTYSCGSIS